MAAVGAIFGICIVIIMLCFVALAITITSAIIGAILRGDY